MKLVTFSRPVASHSAGDKRLVTDVVADDLRADGALSAEEPWGEPEVEPPAPVKPTRLAAKPARALSTFARRKS